MGILQPVFRPLFSPIMRRTFGQLPPAGGGGSPSLTDQVRALFTKYSGVGGMWRMDDASLLFQSSAGTGAVANGDPVGYVTDLNNGAYPLLQATSTKRPAYNGNGVTPDGVDDCYTTASIDFTACDKMVTGMGYTKVDDIYREQITLGNYAAATGSAR